MASLKPNSFRMASQSRTVKTSFEDFFLPLVGKEVLEVVFGIFCEIADRIAEGLLLRQFSHAQFSPQALVQTKDIPMGVTMRRVVAGDVEPAAIVKCE